MREPSLAELDKIRREGYRPGVVVCLINQEKLLMAYSVEHGLWQIPQGGIMGGESLMTALVRTVEEELGEEVASGVNLSLEIVGVDRVEFPPNKTEGKSIMTETGEELSMKGKHYFLAKSECLVTEFDMSKCVYGVVRWVGYKEALELASQIYQRGKRRMTETAIERLKEAKAIT